MSTIWGIMQGRFTDKGGFYPQQFPWGNWQQEFFTAQACHIDCIEWMFNSERFEENPLWTKSGRSEIRSIMVNSNVEVRSICSNFFMQHSLESEEALNCLRYLLDAGEELGIRQIIIPLFGASEILYTSKIVERFKTIEDLLSRRKICIGFESDLSIEDQLYICEMLQMDQIGICYDVGNSAGNGYNYIDDIAKAQEYLLEVHLKDKAYKGNSVMFGEGAVAFRDVFQTLDSRNTNMFIFESYFGTSAVKDTSKNIEFIREMYPHDQ